MEFPPLNVANQSNSCLWNEHFPSHSSMYFDAEIWDVFSTQQIIARVIAWQKAAVGNRFRTAEPKSHAKHILQLSMPPLPAGFVPFTQLAESSLNANNKVTLLIHVCDALHTLQTARFYMGLLLPDMLYFHPQTLDVVMDIQPFPSGNPFVNDLIGGYPLPLVGRFTRSLMMTRLADFYAIGMLSRWVFAGSFGDDDRLQTPPELAHLCDTLVNEPESILHLESITNAFRQFIGMDPVEIRLPDHPQSAKEWLHPPAPPISEQGQQMFRRFLHGEGQQILTVICGDETTRTDVIRQHINEVLELDYFITVTCRNLPFATLRELIDRTEFNARAGTATSIHNLRKLHRKLDMLLRMHDYGDDVVFALADWLFDFCREVLPAFEYQNLYLVFDRSQDFDEDSLRVFQRFWQEYCNQVPQVNIIITGSALPDLYQSSSSADLQIGHADPFVYEKVIRSQLAGLSQPDVRELVEWFLKTDITYAHTRIAIEHFTESGWLCLTKQGWQLHGHLPLYLDPDDLVKRRLHSLEPAELHLLLTFVAFPSQIRARSMFRANGMDGATLNHWLGSLYRAGLILAYHDDSVFVPVEVVRVVQTTVEKDAITAASVHALGLQRVYRPHALPHLILLSKLAGQTRSEYFYTMKYYREIRSALSYERKKLQLENILQLQHSLGRKRTLCWARLLTDTYYKLNRLIDAGQLAEDLFKRTGDIRDEIRWLLMSMFQNKLDVAATQNVLLAYLQDQSEPLYSRVQAACWLTRSDFFLPLQREGADKLHKFYYDDVYPNASYLSVRLFAEFTIYYTIVTFQYFPDRETASLVLLEMLESVLADSPHRDIVSLLYDAYVFQSNIRLCRKYTQKLLEASIRSGSTAKEQVCHLNGMELSLFQGDVSSYRMHKEHVVLVDEIRRADLKEQYLLHQLIYACEWRKWGEFEAVNELLRHSEVTVSTRALWSVYQWYAAARQQQPLPARPKWEEENHYTLFLDALEALTANAVESAIQLFERSISANGYHLTAGWSYREMITLLLERRDEQVQVWLDRFERYLKKYSYDLFWPDFHRLQAVHREQRNEHQQAILYLRRALNGYQLIEKRDYTEQTEAHLARLIAPPYIPSDSPILRDPVGLSLIEDRTKFLNQSLDLLIVIQLSEHVTESLDLAGTCERLTDALFEYFPVTRADINLNLYHGQSTYSFTASGIVNTHEDTSNKVSLDARHTFELYKEKAQSMQLDVYVQNLSEMKQRHMAHFLSVIRPHLANAIHYQEMMIDNLTGFYQRRYFWERLKEEFDLSIRYGLDLSLIMLDIDNFRMINNYGHPEGDKVLREFSEIVRTVLRKYDVPGRYGGEEILLILPKTDGQAAMRLAEKLRIEIEEEFAEGRPYTVTISAGVSSLRLCNVNSAEELISSADDAELMAKAAGKNRVIAAWQDTPVLVNLVVNQA